MFVDLHLHTTASDGVMSPKDVCRLAKRFGILVVVTDHDTTRGQEKIMSLCPDMTIDGTYAMEVTGGVHAELDDGTVTPVHVNVYCPFSFERREIDRECGRSPDARCVIRWAKSNGCLAQWNHPLYWFYAIRPWKWKEVIDAVINARPHMIELHNANETFISNRATKRTLKVKTVAGAVRRSRELGIALTANTDAHVPHGFAAAFNTLPFSDSVTFEEFARAVKRQDVVPAKMTKCSVCGKVWIASAWFDGTKIGSLLKPLRWVCGVNKQSIEWIKARWYTAD